MTEIDTLYKKMNSLLERAKMFEKKADEVLEQIKELEEKEALRKFKGKVIIMGKWAFILKGWNTKKYKDGYTFREVSAQHTGKIVCFFKNGKSKDFGENCYLGFSSPKDILEKARLANPKEIERFNNAK